MPTVTRTGILPKDFTVILNREILPVEHRLAIAAFATAQLANIRDINRDALGYDPKARSFVDGQENGSLFGIKLNGGRAVYQFDVASSVKDIAAAALKMLIDRSPVVSGAYRDAHTMFVEGEPIDSVARIGERDQVIIANPLPYARRIEIGRTKSGRAFTVQVENRIYERTAKSLAAQYQDRAKIEFRYIELEGAYQVTGEMQRRTPRYAVAGEGRTRKRRAEPGSAVQSPAIIIKPLVT